MNAAAAIFAPHVPGISEGSPPAATVPGAPTLAALEVQVAALKATWTAATGATASTYNVYLKQGADPVVPTDFYDETTLLEYTVAGLAGADWRIKVTAVGTEGEGFPSAVQTAAPDIVPPPSVLTATALAINQIELDLTPPATYDTIDIAFTLDGSTPDETDQAITGLVATDFPYIHNIGALVAPDAPTISSTTPDEAEVVVAWAAPAAGDIVDTYSVYAKQGGDPIPGDTPYQSGITFPGSLSVLGLGGADWRFAVSAVNAIGETFSAVDLQDPDPVPAPTGLTAASLVLAIQLNIDPITDPLVTIDVHFTDDGSTPDENDPLVPGITTTNNFPITHGPLAP